MNNNRLEKLIHRAVKGGELTIAFFGGSITQGSLADKPEEMYARRVFSWWEKTFPQATFHYVNGGIGGTTSHYGVSRVVTDLLMYQPDFVVVDFSVNDEPDTFFQETYEGLLRKILSWDSKPAVLLLNNIYYDSGKTAQDFHNEIGDYYDIPHVSIRESVYADMKAGKYTKEQLTPDGLHPNSFGHGLVAQQIINYLEEVKEVLDEKKGRLLDGIEKKTEIRQEKEIASKELLKDFSKDLLLEEGFGEQSIVQKKKADKKEETLLPKSLTPNTYENTKRFTIREVSPKLSGFLPDTREKKGMLDHFKNGWIGKKAGDNIAFTLEASNIAVQYRKTIDRPALRAKIVLDEDVENTVILDGNFDEDWGDCLWLEPILHHGEKKVHTVEITILEDEEKNKNNENKKEKEKNKEERIKDNVENTKKDGRDDVEAEKEKTPFYLLSVIGDF